MDAVRVYLLLVVELVFMGKEDKNCIPRHSVSLIWILKSYPNSKKWWSKKDNVLPRALAWSNVYQFENELNGFLDRAANEWFQKQGNGNNDMLLFEGGDGFVDSVGGDKNHEKEVAIVKVDDARIAKLERILNDNFIPCNDRSKDEMYDSPNCVTDNDVNERIDVSSNYSMSTCSRHVVDNPEVACAGTGIHNPARNNDSRNSNHNAVNTRLSCSANDHMCFSSEMHNDEVVVAGTAIHNADEMYDSPNCVTDNDVNERIGVSSNYPILNSSGNDMCNAVVVVACMGIDKPDGHNDNPNANDNDVNQGIDPMSTCSGLDMHLAEVSIAGMEIDKGDGHIDILTANDNDVNLAKSISVMPISVSPNMLNVEVAICSMGFQNEVAPNVVYEGNVVSAKEVGVDGYSQREPSTLNALIEGFDSQNNNQENEFADEFMDVLNDVDEQEEKLIDTVKAQSNKSDYVNVVTDDYKPCLASVFAQVKKKRKKSDMKTNYVLRSAKERKKRLAMALESPFGQQPPVTPVLPKRISRSVNCDFILPPDFEEDVSGQPKMRSINELMTMEVFVEVSLPDGLAEYLQMKDPPNYRFPWGYRDSPVDREFWLVLACLDKSKQGWLKDSVYSNRRLWWRNMKRTFPQQLTLYLNEHGVLQSKGIAVERYEITYKFLTVIEQADRYGDCAMIDREVERDYGIARRLLEVAKE
ncbi:hypothetical protein Tco_0619469, partial [Tanacetum coccineum]